jgi:hypothetical protein
MLNFPFFQFSLHELGSDNDRLGRVNISILETRSDKIPEVSRVIIQFSPAGRCWGFQGRLAPE